MFFISNFPQNKENEMQFALLIVEILLILFFPL